MTRGRNTWGIVGRACVLAAVVAVAAPATAGAQSGVDEYTLDIPGSGSGSGDSGDPSAGAAGSAGGGGGSTGGEGAGGNGGAGGGAGEDSGRGDGGRSDRHEAIADDRTVGGIGDSRSAPEVVADTLFDGAMLPLLGALALITGIGAWRLVRHRRTLTGAAG